MKIKKFLTEYPELLKEWNYGKNVISPTKYVVGSAKKVWWKCSICGHEWETSIRHRTLRGNGCPICAKQKMTDNRLKSILNKKGGIKNPILLKEWDYEKNKNLLPQNFTDGSNKSVWWKCSKCGYSWKSKILNRKTRGCPLCANKIVVSGINDLATTHPQLAKEWDYEKNGDLLPTTVTYGNGKKVWWICPNGHKYQATILHRTSGTNCPICNSGRQTSFAEQAFLFYIKKIYPDTISRYNEIFKKGMELDIYIPSIRTGIEYDGVFWHKNKREREERKYQICKKQGIKLIRIREGENFNCKGIADSCYHKENLDKKQNLQDLITVVLMDLTMWTRKTPYLHFTVNIERDTFEIRKYMMDLSKNSLAIVNPELSKEWYYEKNGDLTPKMFLPNSSQKVWWKCSKCGHIWKTAIGHRTSNTGCPNCYRLNNKGAKHCEAKHIFQYSKDGHFIKEWGCISDASRDLKINSSNISMCAGHKRRIAGGYRWEYAYAKQLNTIAPIKKRHKGTGGKTVLQLDDDGNIIKEYKSLTEAAEKLNMDASNISKVLHGQCKKAGGYKWKLK
ncbi:MAG: hypothetical protein IJT84_06350 [Clostridia bacterium]|nr:hypothetical protein [Clostridia bacterium]